MRKSKILIICLLVVFAVMTSLCFSGCGRTFTVTFEGNGGYLVEGETTQTVKNGKDLVSPVFAMDGYNFVGWSEDLAGLNSDTTVQAVWVEAKYRIMYDLAGGIASTEKNPTEYTITSPTINIFNPTKRGYEFVGWSGTGLASATTELSIRKGSFGNKNFTANWRINEYTISYVLNGGSFDQAVPTKFTVNSSNVNLVKPVRKGYAFAGWTGYDLTKPATDVVIKPGSIDNREYTANWTAIKYPVSFDLNGGTVNGNGEYQDKLVAYETKIGSLPIPKKDGMTFKGWFYDGQPITSEDVYGFDHPITITAEYESGYTVKFVLETIVQVPQSNGFVANVPVECVYGVDGSTVKEDEAVAVGERLYDLIDAEVAAKYSSLYQFVGWMYTNSSGEEIEVTSDTVFTDAIFDTSEIILRVKCKNAKGPTITG